MTVLARRFAIICLTFAVFAISMTMAVNSQPHRIVPGQIGLAASCTEQTWMHCSITK